jgi:signal peptidase I
LSPAARRYFGCVLPLLLCTFGCGTVLLAGYASRVAVQVSHVRDASMAPLMVPGWTVIVNNMAYWTDEPRVGHVVTVGHDGNWYLRRIVALPGETVEVKDGKIIVDGKPRDPGYTPHGVGPDAGPITLGPTEYFVMADDREAPDSRVWGPIERDDIYGLAVFQMDRQRNFLPVLVTPTPAPVAGTPVPDSP